MKEFNHERAWRELAEPAFRALSPEVRALYERVVTECRELHQDHQLLQIWPEDPSLREAFEAINTPELAIAARAIHDFGHWAPAETNPDVTGAYWKFGHYADQVLSPRLGLPLNCVDTYPNGTGYQVHEGLLRAWASKETRTAGSFWMWKEIGLATPDVLERAREIPTPTIRLNADAYEDVEEWHQRLLGACGGTAGAWLETDRFMEERERCGVCFKSHLATGMKPKPSVTGRGGDLVCPTCWTKQKRDAQLHARICDTCGHEWQATTSCGKHDFCSLKCEAEYEQAHTT